jgi:hypothetical protein
MLTFDAFSFIQVTFILFILLGFSAGIIGVRQATAVPARVPQPIISPP